MRHGEVTEAARRWMHIPYQRVAMKEVGLPSGRRIDVLGYEPYGNVFRLVECKATPEDLKRLPDQLEAYRRFADLLYLAVPEGLEAEARPLLPRKVGLLVVGEARPTGYGRTVDCAKAPRTVLIPDRERGTMTARALVWLMTHYEATRECRNCGHTSPHGPA